MKSGVRDFKFLIISIVCILILIFSIAGTVIGRQTDEYELNNPYYKQMENNYLKEVKDVLSDLGLENSGLSLTKVIFPNGGREYTLLLHHCKMNKIKEAEKEKIMEQLRAIENISCKWPVTIETIL